MTTIRSRVWNLAGLSGVLSGVLASAASLIIVRIRVDSDVQGLETSLLVSLAVGIVCAVAFGALAAIVANRVMRPLGQLESVTRDVVLGRYRRHLIDSLTGGAEVEAVGAAYRSLIDRVHEVDARDRQFLMSISHELRTPLTAIAGHAQALEDGIMEDPEMQARSFEVIRTETGRLNRLVEDIIDLAKLRSNRFNTAVENVMLNELGEHLMAIFEDQSSHPGIEIRGDFEHIAFNSDGHRILQILRNLINNSLRYARTNVTVRGERVRNRIRVTVSNDGDPIPEEQHEKIFEPFIGTKREGGMGLGLAIGRELSWALGGNLRTVPTTEGAIFELTLPLEPPGRGR